MEHVRFSFPIVVVSPITLHDPLFTGILARPFQRLRRPYRGRTLGHGGPQGWRLAPPLGQHLFLEHGRGGAHRRRAWRGASELAHGHGGGVRLPLDCLRLPGALLEKAARRPAPAAHGPHPHGMAQPASSTAGSSCGARSTLRSVIAPAGPSSSRHSASSGCSSYGAISSAFTATTTISAHGSTRTSPVSSAATSPPSRPSAR